MIGCLKARATIEILKGKPSAALEKQPAKLIETFKNLALTFLGTPTTQIPTTQISLVEKSTESQKAELGVSSARASGAPISELPIILSWIGFETENDVEMHRIDHGALPAQAFLQADIDATIRSLRALGIACINFPMRPQNSESKPPPFQLWAYLPN